jgi:hypothetical protein
MVASLVLDGTPGRRVQILNGQLAGVDHGRELTREGLGDDLPNPPAVQSDKARGDTMQLRIVEHFTDARVYAG